MKVFPINAEVEEDTEEYSKVKTECSLPPKEKKYIKETCSLDWESRTSTGRGNSENKFRMPLL